MCGATTLSQSAPSVMSAASAVTSKLPSMSSLAPSNLSSKLPSLSSLAPSSVYTGVRDTITPYVPLIDLTSAWETASAAKDTASRYIPTWTTKTLGGYAGKKLAMWGAGRTWDSIKERYSQAVSGSSEDV